MNALITILALSTAVQAQERGAMPDLDVNTFRPRLDAGPTLWTDSSEQYKTGTVHAGLLGHWQHGPLEYVYGDGESREVLLKDAVTTHVVASVALDRFRVGFDFPIHILSKGAGVQAGTGTGDLMVDGKVTLVDPAGGGLGLALAGRIGLPTGSVSAALSEDGLTGELRAIADMHFGNFMLAGNVGMRFRPETELEAATLNDQVVLRIAGAYDLTDQGSVALEVGSYVAPGAGMTGLPVEAMLSGSGRISPAFVVRGGVGRGITQAVGSPAVRVVAGLTYSPLKADDADGDGIYSDFDRCPQLAEDMDGWEDEDGCPDTDNDKDGFPDAEDACPDQAEDMDGWEDEDGCPELPTQLSITFQDQKGTVVPSVAATIAGTELSGEGNPVLIVVDPGSYTLTAKAEGFKDTEVQFAVPRYEESSFTFKLSDLGMASLKITVVSPEGERVENAYWYPIGGARIPVDQGQAMSADPGNYDIVVGAEGFGLSRLTVEVNEDATTEVQVSLARPRIEVTKNKINLKEKVFFDTGKSTIKVESHPLLDEVADVLLATPEILKIRVEGHTDSRGGDLDNLKLSQARAEAVVKYLVAQGVDGERMQAVGFGEQQPIDKADNADAWEKNRRVEVFILNMAGDSE